MNNSNYDTFNSNYTWQDALLWGNFRSHCKKATAGNLGNRIVHAFIAAIQFLPIISQISSICEKLFIDHFSSKPHLSETQPLVNRYVSLGAVETKSIKAPQKHRQLSNLDREFLNLPIPLASLSKEIDFYSDSATFYGYNAEGIRDYGWGCAWRAIQTCLSAYKITPSFKELFHSFGSLEALNTLYQNKYPSKTLPDLKACAPHNIPTGWAEPFIGHLALHFYYISSELETVNGLPSCYAPPNVFHNNSLCFDAFRNRLKKHFEKENSAPIMMDDGTYALNVVGIKLVEAENSTTKVKEFHTILWIADPHIKEGVNQLLDKENSPVGLYKVTLNSTGKQISCSLNNEDSHQVPYMFSPGSYQGLHFDRKKWMVLFPL